MSLPDIAAILTDRAAHAGLQIPERLASQLTVYYQVLAHWNQKINLTALEDPDEAVDRLLLEPVAAAAHLPRGVDLIDLGSGGGSPAIPLALALEARRLVMVESRVRKAAFLREALREVGLQGQVESARFEEVAKRQDLLGSFGAGSVRAVRLDSSVFCAFESLIAAGGAVALFRTIGAPDPPVGLPPSFDFVVSRQLIPATHAAVAILRKRRLFHVEQSTAT